MTEVARAGRCLRAEPGGRRARPAPGKVVVAAGVEHFAVVPGLLAGLPPAVCTHSSAHTDLSAFAGQRVIVVGAGQSALERAALLHENGATVQVVARRAKVAWNGAAAGPGPAAAAADA